jgi:hypothetical protein
MTIEQQDCGLILVCYEQQNAGYNMFCSEQQLAIINSIINYVGFVCTYISEDRHYSVDIKGDSNDLHLKWSGVHCC